MFTALQAASKSELAKLKAANASYAVLLNTPHGRAFEANVGNADIIKLYATLASPQVSADGGAISNGDTSDSGASGTSATPTPTPVPREGVNCLRAGEDAPTTPAAKIRVLNFGKDSVWHPRNKYLADLTLEIDLMEDTENWEAPPERLPRPVHIAPFAGFSGNITAFGILRECNDHTTVVQLDNRHRALR